MFPILLEAGPGSSAGSSILDSSVVSFVIDGIKDVIGLCTVQPIGTFITIGLVGAVVGLGLRLLKSVKR